MRFSFLTESKRPSCARLKDGRVIEFAYIDPAVRAASFKGHWRTVEVCALLDGKDIGHITISWISKEAVKKMSLWDVLKEKGHCILPQTEEGFGGREIRGEDHTYQMWKNIHWWAHRRPSSLPPAEKDEGWQTGDVSMLPRNQWPTEEQMQRDIDEMEQKFQHHKEAWVKDHLRLIDHPFIEFGEVDVPYRRLGVATAMVEAGARWMAERGMYLRSSTLPYGAENDFWSGIDAKGALPITKRNVFKGKTSRIIDYREPKKSSR